MWLFYQYLFNRITFLLEFRVPQGAAILVCSLPIKSRKRMARDLRNISAGYFNQPDTDCIAQSGRAHDRVVGTFNVKI